jgi:phage shock protein A
MPESEENEMLGTFRTLFAGASARAEETLRDTYAVELIDQKIREADDGLRAAKATLASLIQRQRSESKLAEALAGRIDDLTARARAALVAGNDALATEAAQAIATMENELALRRETLARLDARVTRLTAGVEAMHRRLIDLRQGAMQARAIRREQAAMAGMRGQPAAADEAQALIDRVLGADDPGERAEILDTIDRGLSQAGLVDRMAEAGFGTAPRSTAAAVLERLKTGA